MSQLLQASIEEIKSKWIDYVSSLVGGAFDGYVLARHPQYWIIKNVLLTALSLFIRQIPEGVKYHSVGQLGFILALYVLMGGA